MLEKVHKGEDGRTCVLAVIQETTQNTTDRIKQMISDKADDTV